MRSKYVWAIGVSLMVGLIAGCKNNEEQPVTVAPSQQPTAAAYPEPPVTTLTPTPEPSRVDTYTPPPVDTTPIPDEERPVARSGSHTAGSSGRSTTPRSHYAPAPSKSTRTYTVKKGDTLQEISQKYYGTTRQWRKIYDANRGKIKGGPDKIVPGMKLTIPPK